MQSVVTFGESSCCTFQLLLAFVEYHILALETVQRIKVLNQLMKLNFHSTLKAKIWFHHHFPAKEFLFQSCVQRKKRTETQYNLQYWVNKLCYTMRFKELDSQNLNVCTNTHSHICYTRIQPTKKENNKNCSYNSEESCRLHVPLATMKSSRHGHNTALTLHFLSITVSNYRPKQLFGWAVVDFAHGIPITLHCRFSYFVFVGQNIQLSF